MILDRELPMSMQYPQVFISDREIPRTAVPLLQHLVDTYASESNKLGSVERAPG